MESLQNFEAHLYIFNQCPSVIFLVWYTKLSVIPIIRNSKSQTLAANGGDGVNSVDL